MACNPDDNPGSMAFFNRLLRIPIYPILTVDERENPEILNGSWTFPNAEPVE